MSAAPIVRPPRVPLLARSVVERATGGALA